MQVRPRDLLCSVIPMVNRAALYTWKFALPLYSYCHQEGTGPTWICPGIVWNMWVVYFVQERLQDESPGDFESLFTKAWDSKTKSLEQKEQEWATVRLLGSLTSHRGKRRALRPLEEESESTCPGEGVLVCSRKSAHWVLCLEGFYLFSAGGHFEEVSTEHSSALQVCSSVCWCIRIVYSGVWAHSQVSFTSALDSSGSNWALCYLLPWLHQFLGLAGSNWVPVICLPG